ncbi:T9SS type A sorting domain-containing protein [Neolewinella aurantiaca]|uniref:T9SS type A sorting domain-containing protein n=1 Tax=Neolewinella aurantiaca TaxID=2602767 RepID=A0A5C7FPY3_9BACT|nr:T9SS type A sorting domain-containing protein [Neolewinella aurantiaca]TXF88002.1 T9SS type A sorting domain-containing protein [Neolewinella aurantiaca]
MIFNIYTSRNLLMLSFLIVGSCSSFAQNCLGGGLTLSSQQQINNFPNDYPGCSVVLGGLTITENTTGSITDLSPLAQLTRIEGRLLVFDNSSLASLTGLDNITEVTSSVRISKCDGLSDLAGLGGVTDISSFLSIDNNDNITQLHGLNSSLTIGGRLEIENNPMLQSLDGVRGVSKVGNTTLSIIDNMMLSNIGGLENIDVATIANLIIEDNVSLEICEIPLVCNYLSVPSRLASITGNAVTCASRQTVEAACTALPAIYSYFTVRPEGKSHLLEWETTYELNNYGFHIEHSTDGVRWVKLAFADGGENEGVYAWSNENPSPGNNFYRLLQQDYDGTMNSSPIRSVYQRTGNASDLLVYPNPATANITIAGVGDTENIIIRLFDQNGRVVRSVVNNKNVSLDGLTPGIYVLEVQTEFEVKVAKLMVH